MYTDTVLTGILRISDDLYEYMTNFVSLNHKIPRNTVYTQDVNSSSDVFPPNCNVYSYDIKLGLHKIRAFYTTTARRRIIKCTIQSCTIY